MRSPVGHEPHSLPESSIRGPNNYFYLRKWSNLLPKLRYLLFFLLHYSKIQPRHQHINKNDKWNPLASMNKIQYCMDFSVIHISILRI